MGVDHVGRGDKSPQNLERETLLQIVMLQNFKHRITCSLALQCRKLCFPLAIHTGFIGMAARGWIKQT